LKNVHVPNLWAFVIFYENLGYIMTIWHIFQLLVSRTKKNLATLLQGPLLFLDLVDGDGVQDAVVGRVLGDEVDLLGGRLLRRKRESQFAAGQRDGVEVILGKTLPRHRMAVRVARGQFFKERLGANFAPRCQFIP
jgi:hypothetical protein